MNERLLCQGAEAKIFEVQYLNKRAVRKERLCKAYRHPELDAELTKKRMVQEIRNTARCRKAGIDAPAIYDVDLAAASTLLEYIDGHTIKAILQANAGSSRVCGTDAPSVPRQPVQTAEGEVDTQPPILSTCAVAAIARRIGSVIGTMHATNLVHGDLTSSNIMIRNSQIAANFSEFCKPCSYRSTSNDDSDDVGMVAATADPPPCKRVRLEKAESNDEDCQSNIMTDVVLLDLGLSCTSAMIEDKAVDLYVLERATGSLGHELFFEEILKGYKNSWKHSEQVIERLDEVRQRGRKRNMEG